MAFKMLDALSTEVILDWCDTGYSGPVTKALNECTNTFYMTS